MGSSHNKPLRKNTPFPTKIMDDEDASPIVATPKITKMKVFRKANFFRPVRIDFDLPEDDDNEVSEKLKTTQQKNI